MIAQSVVGDLPLVDLVMRNRMRAWTDERHFATQNIQLGNVGSTLGPPLFAASMAAIGPHGLLVPALALSVGGAAIALWAERRAALVKRATTAGRIG